MIKTLSLYRRTVWISVAVLCISACTQNGGRVDFPAEESEFAQPISRPFKFGDPISIQWDNPNPIRPILSRRFDLSKVPSKPLDIGYPTPLKKPMDQSPLDWKNLPDTTFDYGGLPTQKLRFKTTLLQPPTISKAGLPAARAGASRGVMESSFSLGLPGYGRSFLEDQHGFLWIATDKGLCRYDGVNLEIYGTEQGLPEVDIWSIVEDRAHRIWMGTNSGDVFVLDRQAGLLHELMDSFSRGPGYGIMLDGKEQLWIVRNGQGVIIVNELDQTIKQFSQKEGLAENFGLDILEDSKGKVWISTGQGVSIVDADAHIVKNLSPAKGTGNETLYAIMQAKDGTIWLGGNSGAFQIDVESKTIKRLWKDQGLDGHNGVFGLGQDSSGRIWIGTDASTAYCFDKENSTIERKEFLGGNQFTFSVLEDKEGQLWFGTTGGGSFILNQKRGQPGTYSVADGLGSNEIWSTVEAKNGLIWIGTTKGIDIYDRQTQSMRHLGKADGLHSDRNNHLFEDSQGQIWSYGNNAGITIINPREGTMKYVGGVQGLRNTRIQRMFEDHQGQMWMGTVDGEVYVYDVKESSVKQITNLTSWKGERIQGMTVDTEGQVWLCSNIAGIMVVDAQGKTMKQLTKRNGLLSNTTYNVLETVKGTFWIGTDKGIDKLDLPQQTITSVTTKEGLVNNEIWTLNERNGVIYAGTTRGLSIIQTNTTKPTSQPRYKVISYGRPQGFPYVDFDLNSAIFTRNGEFWAGVEIQALLVMNEPSPDSIVPTTHITGLTTLDKLKHFSDRSFVEARLNKVDTLWRPEGGAFYPNKKEALDVQYAQDKAIRWDSVDAAYHLPINLQLPSDENYLSFSYAGSTFSNPDKVKYRYILEGIDKAWSPISASTQSENYRDLPPGRYIFKVRSKGMNEVWSEPAEFNFIILPPWWKSWWAYSIYLLLFLGAGWRVHLFQKELTVKRERERIRERELAQAREIEKAYNDLKATQSQLIQSEKMASLGELTAGIAHEIQNPLNFVNNFSEVNKELLQEMSDELNQGRTEDAKAIAKSIMENEEKILFHGKRADSIVKGMLQHSRASSGVKEPTDINVLADEYLRLAYHGLRAKDKSFNATMKTELDPTLGKASVVPQDLGRVILNLITNGFYAVTEKKRQGIEGYEPTVTVITKKAANHLTIAVRDNGNGIPKNIQDKIFQPFFTTKPSGKGTGLGLSMSYDIITKVHNGKIDVDSRPGEGTTFTITIPNHPS